LLQYLVLVSKYNNNTTGFNFIYADNKSDVGVICRTRYSQNKIVIGNKISEQVNSFNKLGNFLSYENEVDINLLAPEFFLI